MERKIYAELLEWKDDPDRKPMILLGCAYKVIFTESTR